MNSPRCGSARVRDGSLPAKLLTLRPGETLYLDDQRDDANPTPLDRIVHAILSRSSALKGRRFSTSGWVAVQMSPIHAKRILAITRIDVIEPWDS